MNNSTKPSIVLVHGAFADSTSWQKVIPLLEKKGFAVTAVQNPLKSLADDVATTQRVIDAQTGDVVLIGHSYGGAVITGAATGNAKVKALVYVAAFAPDAGEPVGGLIGKFPAPPLGTALVPDSAGFFRVVHSCHLDVAWASLLAARSPTPGGSHLRTGHRARN